MKLRITYGQYSMNKNITDLNEVKPAIEEFFNKYSLTEKAWASFEITGDCNVKIQKDISLNMDLSALFG